MPSIGRIALLTVVSTVHALAATSGAADPPDCGATSFGVLATSPTVALCMQDSGIPLLTMKEPPTPDQLTVICKTAPCRELMQLFIDMDPVECTIPLGGHLLLRSDIIDRTTQHCAGVGLPLTTKTPPVQQISTSQPASAAGYCGTGGIMTLAVVAVQVLFVLS